MTTDKFRLTRTPSDAVRMMSDGGGAVEFSRDDKRLSEGEKRED